MNARKFHITGEQIDSVINALAEIPAKQSYFPIELLRRVIAMQEVIEQAVEMVKDEIPVAEEIAHKVFDGVKNVVAEIKGNDVAPVNEVDGA